MVNQAGETTLTLTLNNHFHSCMTIPTDCGELIVLSPDGEMTQAILKYRYSKETNPVSFGDSFTLRNEP